MGCGLGYCKHFHKGKKKNLPTQVARIQLEEQEAATALSDTGQRPSATLHSEYSGS
jgi:hypothetical protein